MKRTTSCGACFALVLVMLMVPALAGATTVSPAPPLAAPARSHHVAVAAERVAAATTATAVPDRDYANREARNPQTADFRGGDGFGIYIGGGAALVLAVVLIILLVR